MHVTLHVDLCTVIGNFGACSSSPAMDFETMYIVKNLAFFAHI